MPPQKTKAEAPYKRNLWSYLYKEQAPYIRSVFLIYGNPLISGYVRKSEMNKHKIQISEPWDFSGPDGTNVIEVTGIRIITGPNKPNWASRYYLVHVDKPFKIKNALVKQLICSPRYVGDTIEMIVNGKCTVGIAKT